MDYRLKEFYEVEKLFDKEQTIQISFSDENKYQDTLNLMECREYIRNAKINNAAVYYKLLDFEEYEKWLKRYIKEEKKITRREWVIGIICSISGALIGLIPFIVQLLTNK